MKESVSGGVPLLCARHGTAFHTHVTIRVEVIKRQQPRTKPAPGPPASCARGMSWSLPGHSRWTAVLAAQSLKHKNVGHSVGRPGKRRWGEQVPSRLCPSERCALGCDGAAVWIGFDVPGGHGSCRSTRTVILTWGGDRGVVCPPLCCACSRPLLFRDLCCSVCSAPFRDGPGGCAVGGAWPTVNSPPRNAPPPPRRSRCAVCL